MISPLFRRRPLCLLREDGSVVDARGAKIAPRGEILLSRALCRFEFYRAPAGLVGGDLAKAVRLKAETGAPFRNSSSLILRAPGGAAIWYWDAAQIAALLRRPPETEIRAVPESLFHGVFNCWRIIELNDGFEAQYWQAGSLMASTWRRRPFNEAQWRAFALGVDEAAVAAPETPPAVTAAALVSSDAWRRQRIGAPWTWRKTEEIMRTGALCVAALAAFCAGYALHLDRLADRDERAAASAHLQLLGNNDARRARAQLELVHAFQARTPSVNVLDVAAQALEALRAFGIDATAWSVTDRQLQVTIPYVRSETPVRDILAEVQRMRSLHDVTLDFASDGNELVISASIGASAAEPPRAAP